MFLDKVDIEVRAGKGGDGKLSFRHERHQAKGGPDGGDGGRGGDVVFEVDHNLNTLSHFRSQKRIKAENGQPGGNGNQRGKAGPDVLIKVPVGTTIYGGMTNDNPPPADQMTKFADLTTDGQRQVIAKGGAGGYGNAHFVSSSRQVPKVVEKGEPGESKQLILELKLVADVGLVGLPNAGKSTLLSVISNARPEIADYPFTTLTPNLGVAEVDGYSFVVADIPGLIAGASQGKGLGDEFLRHVERTAVLIHLIDATPEDVAADYRTIMSELKSYQVDLSAKPQLVALTKIDALSPPKLKTVKQTLKRVQGDKKVFAISAVAHQGIDELLRAVVPFIKAARSQRQAEIAALPVIDESTLRDNGWQVTPEGAGYRVQGTKVERFAVRTDWQSEAGVGRMRDILKKMGIARELERRGIQPGDLVHIGHQSLEWI
jgi:GTP-binding protein